MGMGMGVGVGGRTAPVSQYDTGNDGGSSVGGGGGGGGGGLPHPSPAALRGSIGSHSPQTQPAPVDARALERYTALSSTPPSLSDRDPAAMMSGPENDDNDTNDTNGDASDDVVAASTPSPTRRSVSPVSDTTPRARQRARSRGRPRPRSQAARAHAHAHAASHSSRHRRVRGQHDHTTRGRRRPDDGHHDTGHLDHRHPQRRRYHHDGFRGERDPLVGDASNDDVDDDGDGDGDDDDAAFVTSDDAYLSDHGGVSDGLQSLASVTDGSVVSTSSSHSRLSAPQQSPTSAAEVVSLYAELAELHQVLQQRSRSLRERQEEFARQRVQAKQLMVEAMGRMAVAARNMVLKVRAVT